MEQKRIKVRLTEKSPYSEYGYYKKGDIGYIDGYVNDNAVIILENGKFAKADLRWIEVVNEEDKNVNTELAEGEDERIKKALIKLVKKAGEGYENVIDGVSIENAIAWLGKQGEHAKFRDSIQVGDKVTRNEDGILVNLSQLNRVAKKDEKQGKQKPAEWSEEDEKILSNIIKDLVHPWNEYIPDRIEDEIKWLKNKLKSLRPQSQWKPSDEQIKVLEFFIPYVTECSVVLQKSKDTLSSLLSDLKKLREE